jgi:hypothetical protein
MRTAAFRALALCLAGCFALASHAQFTDNFDDGDFTTGTLWSGDDALFTVVSGQLRSNSPGAANYQLSTASTQATDAQWEFFLNLKFATSGANYVDVYLMSSAADLASGVNGYTVRIGGTSDRVELFRSDAGTGTSLIASADGIVNSSSDNPFRILVKRDAANNWTLQLDDGNTGTYATAGSATDATYTSCSHFGIRIEQSTAASPVNNHFFDDISVGPIVLDLTPPEILSVTATSATNVDVLYNEPLDPGFIGTYDIIPFIGVSAAVQDGTDPALVHVTPAIAFTSGNTYSLLSNGAQDAAGNAAPNVSTDFTYVVPAVAGPRDVVINELMADPSPAVGLPEAEFVELYNANLTESYDLAGWTFSDGSTTSTLPAFTLVPGAHCMVVDDAVAGLFSAYPNVVVVSTFPSLNNDGDPLTLKDGNGTLIDAVTYALSWYQDAAKADGGWTLEQVDPTTPCSGAANWRASNAAAGGTPSAQNSIFAIVPDTEAPSLTTVLVNDASAIVLQFSEAMDIGTLASGTYTITPTIAIGSAIATSASTVQLTLAQPLAAGQLYTITATNVSDCPGNPIGTANTATFALPEPVAAGDVVINEVLYDPRGSGSDFVEVYNRSNKVLSLAGWKLANVTNGSVASPITITGTSYLLLPGEFVLITEDALNVEAEYPQSRMDRFLVADLPSYTNGEGSVVLQDPMGVQLDRLDYTDDLHFTLLNETEGVSLERVDPDRPTGDNSNWHSAADDAGFATPGFQNSQYAPAPSGGGELVATPEIFSPDNDGYQDVLTLTYTFGEPGYVGTMIVFDIAGREAKVLMNNVLLGTSGAISWDGILETGEKARIGPYVVYLEVFDLSGNVQKFRRTVTLAHRL